MRQGVNLGGRMSTGFQYRHARELLCHSRMDSNSIGQILKKKVSLYVYTYICMYTFTIVKFLIFCCRMYVCIYVCMYVCMYVCTDIGHMIWMCIDRIVRSSRRLILTL